MSKENLFEWNDAIHKLNEINNNNFKKILEEVDNSVTSEQLFRDGEIIDDSGEYDQWYSDAVGGCYNRVKIFKLDGKFYVYKEKITVNRDCSEQAECIAFYELK